MSDNISTNDVSAVIPRARDPHDDLLLAGMRTRSRSSHVNHATVHVSAPSATPLGEDDIFHVNLSEYLDDLYASESKVDRTGLEDIINASNITKKHTNRREKVEESFIRSLESVGKYQSHVFF